MEVGSGECVKLQKSPPHDGNFKLSALAGVIDLQLAADWSGGLCSEGGCFRLASHPKSQLAASPLPLLFCFSNSFANGTVYCGIFAHLFYANDTLLCVGEYKGGRCSWISGRLLASLMNLRS